MSCLFDHEISLIRQQLAVDTECAAQGALDLCRTVVADAQAARRSSNQRVERRDVGGRGLVQSGHAAASVAGRQVMITFELQDSGRIAVYTKPTEPRSIGGVLDDGLRLWRLSVPKTWPLAVLAQLVVAVPLLWLAYKFPAMAPGARGSGALAAANAANLQFMTNLIKSPSTWLAYAFMLIFSTI